MGVEGGGEDDVPADGQRGLLHLAPQDGVAHDARRLPHLLQHFVQALDAAHHCALLDVRQLGDLSKGLSEDERGESGVMDYKQGRGLEDMTADVLKFKVNDRVEKKNLFTNHLWMKLIRRYENL